MIFNFIKAILPNKHTTDTSYFVLGSVGMNTNVKTILYRHTFPRIPFDKNYRNLSNGDTISWLFCVKSLKYLFNILDTNFWVMGNWVKSKFIYTTYVIHITTTVTYIILIEAGE